MTAAPHRPRSRIACVSTYGGHAGGAAVAMRRLAAALEAAGATVEIVARQGPEPAALDPPAGTGRRIERRMRRRIRRAREPLSNTLFSADWPAWDVSAHPALQAADVVHLHWVAGFLDAEAIRRIVSLGKPVVWTQHDLRAFTGGCHYPAGCAGFTTTCARCPQLAPRLHAVPQRSLARSRRRLQGLPLTFVSPSRWLADELARSSLFNAACHALHVIPNGIDLDRYAPATDKAAARMRLGLPPTGLAVILGSVSLDERRKGFRQAGAALAAFAAQVRAAGGSPPVAVTYGAGGPPLRGIPQRHLGPLDEASVIAALHACDVHLTMTQEDNLPNTVVESLACGLPVVGTRVGGLPEAVTCGAEGWLVDPDDVTAAAACLAQLARDPALLEAASRAARSRAVADFDAHLQARRHLAVYAAARSNTPAGRTSTTVRIAPLTPLTPAAVSLLAPAAACRGGLRRLRRIGLAVRRAPRLRG